MAADSAAQARPEAPRCPPPGGSAERAAETVHRSFASSLWAIRLARIDEGFPRVCSHRGAARRILAFVTDTAAVARLLQDLGEPTPPPPVSPARGPPEWEESFDPRPAFDPSAAEPAPAFAFDQSASGSTPP
jgi:hypothetical protein